MSSKRQNEQPAESSINLSDIYYILFRQKWIILASVVLAIIVGAGLMVAKPPQFQSEAKLLVRYVVDKTLGPAENDVAMRSPEHGDTIISTELEILTSLDLAQQVVQDIGSASILGKDAKGDPNYDTNAAAGIVAKNLTIDPLSKGSVIHIIFEHQDPIVAQSVLGEIIGSYFKKHAQMHQAVGVFGDFLTSETKRLRSELEDTEKQLRRAKNEAGIISLEDAKKGWADQMAKVTQDLFDAESELAEHRAALGSITPVAQNPVDTNAPATNINTEIPSAKLREYKSISIRLSQDMKVEDEYLNRRGFREESVYVKEIRAQIAAEETVKKKLEEEFPSLATVLVTTPLVGQGNNTSGTELVNEAARVKMLEAKTNRLHTQLVQIRAEASKLDDLESPIQELQRQKDLKEANLRHFLSNLEQSRIDAELGAGKGSGEISIVESPTPPLKRRPKTFNKMLGGAVAGCLGAGLGLAFLIEMFLDGTVRRPSEVEKRLKLPLFISIPDMSQNSSKRLATTNGQKPLLIADTPKETGTALVPSNGVPLGTDIADIPPWDHNHALHRFYAGLRERLIVNFEVRNLTHNPKLVAVTSCGRGAGVSSIAAGLAASLSETGVGNVLLVDMNLEQRIAQQFHKGKPGIGLDVALESSTMESAMVSENLYVASEGGDEKLPRVMPKRFAALMPKLKASDYDYIIFDMPPVSQTSMTPRLAGLMDMVLLVIESEKTTRETVQRANALLAESKATVSTVLNKTKTYIPIKLHQDFLNDA